MSDDIKMCETCGKRPAQEPHECPYKAEVNDDHELCTCCEDCEAKCAMDI